ncbi:MAG: hypothetical protein O3B13_04090 [Planctomycetota bacterium]|nr:hypothetical protein [Planctomycetota bacterium]MDA1162263.1 hypothetical protein [Planctomycetota bacterium]
MSVEFSQWLKAGRRRFQKVAAMNRPPPGESLLDNLFPDIVTAWLDFRLESSNEDCRQSMAAARRPHHAPTNADQNPPACPRTHYGHLHSKTRNQKRHFR